MDHVIVVTGATGGLGSAVAKRFAADGDRVVINYTKSAETAEKLAAEINAGPGTAMTFQADVRNWDQVKRMMDSAVAKWQRIDVLVNAAGGLTYGVSHPFNVWEMDEALWDEIVDINLKGTFLSIKAAIPYMIKQKDGHIINVSSGKALAGCAGQANYAAAKAGVLGLMKSVAAEAGQYNIKVNAVAPGLVLHPRLAATYTPEEYARIKGLGVLGRTGEAGEFADFVFHLSTMKNISGQTINLDSRILS
jgi:3-oxoacyl-[acyl-carrier protein] reductase